jgi:hypothetical protein
LEALVAEHDEGRIENPILHARFSDSRHRSTPENN